MCEFKSAICFKNGDILHDKYIDSHEDLILKFGLKESKMRNWVCVEFYPNNTDDVANIDKYKFHVDDDLQDWITDQLIKKWTGKLKAIVSKMIISTDVPILSGGRWILKGNIKIHKTTKGCLVIHGGEAQIKHGGYMQVKNGGRMQIEYGGRMQVKYGQEMQVENGQKMQKGGK